MTGPPSLPEVNRRMGLEALGRPLSPAGMVRFLQQFETGRGGPTADRHQWLPHVGVRDLARATREQRRS